MNIRIAYVVSNLKRIGPTNQTLNIIKYSGVKDNCLIVTLFSEPQDSQIDDFKDLNIPIINLGLTKLSALIIGRSRLLNELKMQKIDIIHSYGTIADTLSQSVSKKLRIKHIITLRFYPAEDFSTRMNFIIGKILTLLYVSVIKKCDYIVSCSYALRDKMICSYRISHITVIQNGVDFNKFKKLDKEKIRHSMGIKSDSIVFISTGSLTKRKRINETIEAFLMSKNSKKQLLLIIGDGYLLNNFMNEYNYNNIRFLGKKNDIGYYLSVADVFVSSSESEGLPNSVLEAISCELPVYLSDIPQHKEILQTISGCGELYPLGNINSLSNLFEQTDKSKIINYSINTKKLIKSSMTMENMGIKYMEYYNSVKI